MAGTDPETRAALIARIVTEGVTRADKPTFYKDAAVEWGMKPTTFNRLKKHGRAQHVAYRQAEIGLDLPRGLFLAIREGEYDRVQRLTEQITDPELRLLILTTLNLPGGQRRRRAGNG